MAEHFPSLDNDNSTTKRNHNTYQRGTNSHHDQAHDPWMKPGQIWPSASDLPFARPARQNLSSVAAIDIAGRQEFLAGILTMSSNSGSGVTSSRKDKATSAALTDAVEVLLCFGALMLRAGNTAARTREWVEVMTRKMGFSAVSVSLSLDSITASVRRSGEQATTMREIGPPGINVSRIVELEQLAKATELEQTPSDIAVKLAEIESMPPRYSSALIAAAVGLASGGFAFLNGAAAVEMTAAAMGGGIGQWARSWMAHRQLNQYGAATLSAIVASGIYVLAAALAHHAGFEFAHYPAGFIASVLF